MPVHGESGSRIGGCLSDLRDGPGARPRPRVYGSAHWGNRMLRVYRPHEGHLTPTELNVTSHSPPEEAAGVVWFDLINPTRHEDHFVEHVLGISIPTREEAQ